MAEEGFFGSVIEVDNLHNVESGFIGFILASMVGEANQLACVSKRHDSPLNIHDLRLEGEGGRKSPFLSMTLAAAVRERGREA